MIGIYLATNPVQALIGFVGLLIVLFMIVLVWRLFLSLKVLLVLVLGIALIAGVGLYVRNNTGLFDLFDLFDVDDGNTDTLVLTDLLGSELIERMELSHKLMHTPSDTETVTLAGGGRAPKLRNQTYTQGISFLRQQAASFSGEYIYIFRTDFDGSSYWTEGIRVDGLMVDYTDFAAGPFRC